MKDKNLSERVTVLTSPAQRQAWEEAASAEMLRLSTWARRVLAREAARRQDEVRVA